MRNPTAPVGKDDFHEVAVRLRVIADAAPAPIRGDANTAAVHAAKVDDATAKAGGDLSKLDPGVMVSLLAEPTAQSAMDRLNRYGKVACGVPASTAPTTSTVGK